RGALRSRRCHGVVCRRLSPDHTSRMAPARQHRHGTFRHRRPAPGAPATRGGRGVRATMSLTFTQLGGLALFEDLGRSGYADLGVSPSGAANRSALARANLAVGNAAGAPAL